MFENSVVESRIRRSNPRRLLMLPLSVGAHLAAIGGLLFASIWHVDMPRHSPAQMAYLVSQAPPPPVPAAAPPAPKRERQPAAFSASLTRPTTAAPVFTPETLPEPAVESAQGNPDPLAPNGTSTGELQDGAQQGASRIGHPGAVPGGGGESDAPLPVGGRVVAPSIIQRVEPRYPDLLIRTRMHGTVVLECIVDRLGRIDKVRVVSSSHALFAESAMAAVRHWRFSPGTLNGRPVPTIFQLTVNFETNR